MIDYRWSEGTGVMSTTLTLFVNGSYVRGCGHYFISSLEPTRYCAYVWGKDDVDCFTYCDSKEAARVLIEVSAKLDGI